MTESLTREQIHERRRHALIAAMRGLFFLLLVVAAKELLVAHTTTFNLLDKHIRRAAYDLSQDWLGITRRGNIPVAVVDISDLPPCPTADNPTDPRRALESAVDAVLQHGPAAIGIDVDFSPGHRINCKYPVVPRSVATRVEDCSHDVLQETEWTDRGGPPFFQYCLRKKKTFFLGVYRTQYHRPENWLGAAVFEKLAASLLLPPESLETEPGEEPSGEQARLYMTRFVEGCSVLPSLSQGLAKAYSKDERPLLRRWLSAATPGFAKRHLIGSIIEQEKTSVPFKGLRASLFLVDFSALKTLRQTKATFTHDGVLVNGDSLAGKLVILGYTDLHHPDVDRFIVPGEEAMEAGVYWHACGADTLVRGELLQPSWAGAIALDLGLYLPIIGIVTLGSLYYSDKPGREIAHERVERLLTILLAVGILICGTYIVGWMRVIWADFLIVALIVLFHPSLEQFLESAGEWIWESGKKVGRRVFLRRSTR